LDHEEIVMLQVFPDKFNENNRVSLSITDFCLLNLSLIVVLKCSYDIFSLGLKFHTCKADTVLLEPHFQTIWVWQFWMGFLTICTGEPGMSNLLISAS
jgi:hypothetical protein